MEWQIRRRPASVTCKGPAETGGSHLISYQKGYETRATSDEEYKHFANDMFNPGNTEEDKQLWVPGNVVPQRCTQGKDREDRVL